MYGNDITLTSAGGTFNITPTIPNATQYRIIGTATLATGVVIQYDPSYTPQKWDKFLFDWGATITLSASTVTVFGTVLTSEQCSGKGIIVCLYDGSAWTVNYFSSKVNKSSGIGGATRVTVPTGGGTVTLDPAKQTPVYSFVGTVTLTSSYTITQCGTPKSGDMFIVYWKSLATVGVNTVTIFGKTLSTSQALAGNVIAITNYDGTAWQSAIIDCDVEAIWERGSGVDSAQTIGTGCQATGLRSVAEGHNTVASGVDSHSEGYQTIASGDGSHAEGIGTEASGDESHAEGLNTIASGNGSHADGQGTEASGTGSHAEGVGTIARGSGSHAKGIYSIAHIIGSSSFSSGRFSITGDCEELKLYLKKLTSDATPSDMLLGDNITTGIEIPTDCIIDFNVRYIAQQISGVAGTIGDVVSQSITFSVQNLAGTLSMVSSGINTIAGLCDVASDIVYYKQAINGALTVTCVPGISGTKVLFVCTGEADKDVQHSCLISMNIQGFGNFSI